MSDQKKSGVITSLEEVFLSREFGREFQPVPVQHDSIGGVTEEGIRPSQLEQVFLSEDFGKPRVQGVAPPRQRRPVGLARGARPERCWPSLPGRAPGTGPSRRSVGSPPRHSSSPASPPAAAGRGLRRSQLWVIESPRPRRALAVRAPDQRTRPGPVPHPPPAGSHHPLRAAVCNWLTRRGRSHRSSSRPGPPAATLVSSPASPAAAPVSTPPAPVSPGTGADASAPAPVSPTGPGAGDLISPSAAMIGNTVTALNNTVTTTAGQLGSAVSTLDPVTGAVGGVGATVSAFGQSLAAL